MCEVFHTLTSTHAKVIISDSERLIKMKIFLFLLQPSILKILHFFLSDSSSLITSVKQKRNLCLQGLLNSQRLVIPYQSLIFQLLLLILDFLWQPPLHAISAHI